MADDESHSKEAPEIISPQEAISRIKAKKEKTPEQLFSIFFPEASHFKESSILLLFDPITHDPTLKQAALAILGIGIFKEEGLQGHAGHKKIPVQQKDLISSLIETHFKYCDVTFSPGDIINRFDSYFDSMVALARLASVTEKMINNVRDDLQKWRDKITKAVSEGNFRSNWRELIKEELISSYEYHPKSQAQALAIVFLKYAPKASNIGIARWVNAVLESLGCPTASESKLREYIEQERKLRPWLSPKSSKNNP